MNRRSAGDSLDQIADEVQGCLRCRLSETRTHAVPGGGNATATLFLVGEAPGRREDETGLPFQGMSGRFLDRCLAEVGSARADVFIGSTNRCRPPGNRNPRRDEMAACAGYLDRQLALVAPRVVLAMGGTAAMRLHPEAVGRSVKVSDLRGQLYPLAPDRALLVTYHPAAAMRFPKQRQPFVDDLAEAVRLASS